MPSRLRDRALISVRQSQNQKLSANFFWEIGFVIKCAARLAGSIRYIETSGQEDIMEYLDFEVEIGEGVGQEYPIVVMHSPAGEARGTLLFPFDALALENRLQALQIALLRSGGKRRKVLSSEEQAVQAFGQALFNAILSGEVRSRYDVSQQMATQQGKGLRLKLHVQAPRLAALPWEFLYDEREGEYVCLSRVTPLVRYVDLPQPVQPLTITPPLRILGMIAAPADLQGLDVQSEQQRLETAVKDLQAQGSVELTWLAGQSWRDLQHAMQNGPWHVFHFIGHGGFDANSQQGLVAFVGETGKSHMLTATDLGRLLADHRSLRLVLLNSCEGARGSELDIFSSTAAVLVRRKVPAVIAMQYEITDASAIEFTRSFYEAVAGGLPVDAALAEARIAISLVVNNSLEWGTPVLYMRSPNGAIFDIPRVSPPKPPQPKIPPPVAGTRPQGQPSLPKVPEPLPAPAPKPPERANVLEKVCHILAEQLDLPTSRVRESSSYVEDLGTDELDLAEIRFAFEEDFEMEFSDADWERLANGTVGDTVSRIFELVETKGVPQSTAAHTKFRAEIHLLTAAEGGRHTPVFSGYRPEMNFGGADVRGTVKLPEGADMLMPGGTEAVIIELEKPAAIQVHAGLTIRESGRTVGTGTVLTVLE